MRKSKGGDEIVAAAFNFTPVPRLNYRVGVPRSGYWQEILNSDAKLYGGADFGNLGGIEAESYSTHGRPFSLKLTVPPLGAVFLKSTA